MFRSNHSRVAWPFQAGLLAGMLFFLAGLPGPLAADGGAKSRWGNWPCWGDQGDGNYRNPVLPSDFSTIGVRCQNGIITIESARNQNITRGPALAARKLWLQSAWGLDGKSQYAYSTNGVAFTPFGETYQLGWGDYRGDRIGIFTYNNDAEAGYVDGDSFTYRYDSPVTRAEPSVRLPANLTIMPLGDSITYGYPGTNGGYRGPLHDLLAPVATNFAFVGSSTNAWSIATLPANQWHNEGHGSYGINNILTNLDGFDDSLYRRHGGADRDPNGGHWFDGIASGSDARPPVYPDLILLLVGANERDHPDGAQARLDKLISKIVTLRPDARLLVARITPMADNRGRTNFVATYNQQLDAVVAKYAASHRVSLVDLNTGFPSDGLSRDHVHPSDSGYNWMARQWYKAIVAAFSKDNR